MEKKKISRCKNGHFFTGDVCRQCNEPKNEQLDQRPGDCVFCGQLCPDGAYGCDTPDPVSAS